MNIGIITGASSGMGKEFVKLTMQNHLDLDEIWVIARRKERLEAWPSLYKRTEISDTSTRFAEERRCRVSETDIRRDTATY